MDGNSTPRGTLLVPFFLSVCRQERVQYTVKKSLVVEGLEKRLCRYVSPKTLKTEALCQKGGDQLTPMTPILTGLIEKCYFMDIFEVELALCICSTPKENLTRQILKSLFVM